MANKFAWNRKKDTDTGRDFYSTAIFTSRPSSLVTEEQALKIPTVKAAVELISNSISTLPIYLYEEVNSDDIRKVENDNRIDVLNHSSNKIDTAQVLKKKIVTDYLLHGQAFIYRKGSELYHLEASKV